MFNSMFDELKEVKYLAEITDFKNLMMYIEIYIIRQYWNFQSKAKLEQIIAIVITHSVFLLIIEIILLKVYKLIKS